MFLASDQAEKGKKSQRQKLLEELYKKYAMGSAAKSNEEVSGGTGATNGE